MGIELGNNSVPRKDPDPVIAGFVIASAVVIILVFQIFVAGLNAERQFRSGFDTNQRPYPYGCISAESEIETSSEIKPVGGFSVFLDVRIGLLLRFALIGFNNLC